MRCTVTEEVGVYPRIQAYPEGIAGQFMSERWEAAITEWYERGRTANLEHLDLAGQPSVSRKDLAHNLDVVYDRLMLHSKVSIKDYYLLRTQIRSLRLTQEESFDSLRQELLNSRSELEAVRSELDSLRSTVETHRPLDARTVKRLVEEIAEQPKLVEKEAVALIESLQIQISASQAQLQEVKELIHSVRAMFGGSS